MEKTKPRLLNHRLRCPYCRDEISAQGLKHGCGVCMAWHHEACWTEHGGCSTCGQRPQKAALQVTPKRAPGNQWSSRRVAFRGGKRFGESEGAYFVEGTVREVEDKLRLMLLALEATVRKLEPGLLTYRTPSRQGSHPAQGAFALTQEPGNNVRIDWWVAPASGFLTTYIVVIAVLFCWTFFMPFVAHHTLVVKPRELVRRLLTAL